MFSKFALGLLLSMSGPVAGMAHEQASKVPWETTPWVQEPSEEFCLSTEDGKRDAFCVTLQADEDGYELCISDEVASTTKCVSSYRFDDSDASEAEGPEEGRWSGINL